MKSVATISVFQRQVVKAITGGCVPLVVKYKEYNKHVVFRQFFHAHWHLRGISVA
jgi:hypothetical protein